MAGMSLFDFFPLMTLAEKITIAATILATNQPKATPKRPHYTVCTSLLKEHPLNGVAPLLSWKPGEGAYAISYGRNGDKAYVFVAGEDDVPDVKLRFLEELWSRVVMVRNMKRRKKRQQPEKSVLDKDIPQEVYDVWKLVIMATYPKLVKRIRKHLAYILLFRDYITAEHIWHHYDRAFLHQFIDLFEMLECHLAKLEEADGPRAAAKQFASSHDLVSIFMILTSQFHNQMGHIWKIIDDIAILEHIGCDKFGKRAHRDYSRHFVKMTLIFLQTFEIVESTRTRFKGCLWDIPIEARSLDQRQILQKQTNDMETFQHGIQKVATEIFNSAVDGDKLRKAINLDIAPQKKVVPPELQIIYTFRRSCPARLYRLVSSSRSTPYLTEAVLAHPICDETKWEATKGVGRVYKTWSLPEGLLSRAQLGKIYNSLCYDIIALAQENSETDEDGLSKFEKEEEERLRLRMSRFRKYKMGMLDHTEKMLHNLQLLTDKN